ncbi:classical arabinogalactan protein 11-like [Cocos nucifera]|uniref:Classical arabinogalactan protein 11-like n=1 Tax=Cocos nucifera TaxID=13894 RepID=A0A8K0N913_COCNU|nr:classical arabinogalactan protein 11-like [Cocos nucifera]
MASLRPLFVLALVLVAVVVTESASSPAPTPSGAPDTNEQNPLLAPRPHTTLPDSGAESPDSDDVDDDDVAPAGSPHAATATKAESPTAEGTSTTDSTESPTAEGTSTTDSTESPTAEGTSTTDSAESPTSSDNSASAIGVTSMAAITAVAASYIVF